MKIEVGKFYKTRDGRKVGPMEKNDDNNYDPEWEFSGPDGYTYRKDGTFGIDGTERDRDLIAEWTDTPEVGTLSELNVNEGDIIIYVGEDATPENKARAYKGLAENGDYYDRDQEWEGSISLWHDGPWSIISRAQPKPEQTGPVRTVTRTTREIVPGQYGPVAVTESQIWMVKLANIPASAQHLTEAITALTAIRDALKENGE